MCFEMTKIRLFKDLKNNVQIKYKNMTSAFSMNQFGQIFIVFMGRYFLENFGWN